MLFFVTTHLCVPNDKMRKDQLPHLVVRGARPTHPTHDPSRDGGTSRSSRRSRRLSADTRIQRLVVVNIQRKDTSAHLPRVARARRVTAARREGLARDAHDPSQIRTRCPDLGTAPLEAIACNMIEQESFESNG